MDYDKIFLRGKYNTLTHEDIPQILGMPITETEIQAIQNVLERPYPQSQNSSLQDIPANNQQIQNPITNPVINSDLADKVQPVDFLNDINSGNFGLIQQIIENKNAYDKAEQIADSLSAKGFNANADSLRQKFHDNAENIRKFANAENINLGAWSNGSGISADDSNFIKDRYNYRQAKDAQEQFEKVENQLKNEYAQSSQQHFDQLYDFYRSKHMPHRQAAILAGRYTMQYQQERTGFLQNAIDNYGIDDGAILNQFGISALGQLATEDNIMGTAYAQAYQLPKDNYNKMLEMQKQQNIADAALQRLRENISAQMARTQFVQGQQNNRTAAQIAAQMNNANTRNETSRRNTLDTINAANERAEKDRQSREAVAKANRDTQLLIAQMKSYRDSITDKKSTAKPRSQIELDKQYGDIVAKFNDFAEKYPDMENPYEEAVTSARRLKDHVFEGDKTTQEGTWSWATDIASEFQLEYGRKPTFNEFTQILRYHLKDSPYAEGVLKNILDQKNDYINWLGADAE